MTFRRVRGQEGAMKQWWVLTMIACSLSVAPAFAQKAYVDYDRDYDRSTIQTYAWGKTDSTLVKTNPRAHDYIVEKLDGYLQQAGLDRADQDPDVFVTYHTSTQQELSVNTDSWGYGYPSSFYWNPYWGGAYGGTATTTVTSYTRGTLIVDVWDVATKKLIWRGSANDIVPPNPEKAYKKIDRALEKILSKWEQAKADEAREAKAAAKKKKG